VRPEGQLHGYLIVVAEETSIGSDRVEGLMALGQLVELSLSNLFAHRRLEDHAMHEERRRIARELHDGLAHELAYIASRSRSAALLSSDDGAAELARSADRALDEARRAITVLAAREPLMLSESIAQTAEDLGQRYGVPIVLKLDDDVNVEPALGEHLLRIVREAICNAVRHGHPTKLTIHLWNDGVRHLVIEDDGIGFDLLGPLHGFGLTSMRERAEAAGGELSMHSEPNAGTRVEVMVP
jgi:signal transduction histidine kinase